MYYARKNNNLISMKFIVKLKLSGIKQSIDRDRRRLYTTYGAIIRMNSIRIFS